MAHEIACFCEDEHNAAALNSLLQHISINEVKQVAVDNDNPLSGKKIVLTGTMEKYTRDEAKDILESMGAKDQGSVSAKTDIVIAGSDGGSQLTKATELGVTVWDEKQFLESIGE